MIFSPFVIFGHTWEFDEKNKCISALIDRNLFYKQFVKNGNFKLQDDGITNLGGVEYVNVIISFHNIKKRQLKVTYKMNFISGEFILSQPLTNDERMVLHKFSSLCYQHYDQIAQIEESKPQNIKNLEQQYMDSVDNYTIKVQGIDEERLVLYLINWMTKSNNFEKVENFNVTII